MSLGGAWRSDRPECVEVDPSRRSWAVSLWVFLAWLIGLALLWLTQVDYDIATTAYGPDSYLRLFRVTQLWESGDWYAQATDRINAPFGMTPHWTRPLDLLLLAGAAPLIPALGFERALWWSGVALSPFLFLTAYFAFLWAVAPIVGQKVERGTVAVFFCQFAILSNALPVRVDQELLLLNALLLTLGLLLRGLLTPTSRRAALLTGLVCSLGVWLSVEMVVGLVLAAGMFGLAWVREGGERAWQNFHFAVGATGALAFGLMLERAPAELFVTSFDEISVVHLVACGLLLLLWTYVVSRQRRVWAPWQRILTLTGGAFVVLLALLWLFPGLAEDPLLLGDPRIRSIWIERIAEFQSLSPAGPGGVGRFLIYLGSGVIVLPSLIWFQIRSWRRTDWAAWLAVLLFTAVYFVLSWDRYRFALFSQAVSAVSLVVLLDRGLNWSLRIRSGLSRAAVHLGGGFALLLGPFFIGGLFSVSEPSGEPVFSPASCDMGAMADFLDSSDEWPEGQTLTFLSALRFGEEIVYRTPHSVVGNSSHRNHAGILDTYDFFAAIDEDAPREVVARRSVDAVLVCLDPAERKFFIRDDGRRSLLDRLREGDSPSWLEGVALPGHLASEFRLYRTSR